MKNLLLTAMVLLATSSSFAASTGTLDISGTVLPINDIVINPNLGNKDSLNITGGEVDKNVASVDETSNNINGYKIMMSSLNSSKLVNSASAAFSTAYTVSYAGGAATTLTTTPTPVKDSGALAGLTTVTSQLTVSVTAYPTAPAGTYGDTITISIVAN
ncbi:MAG: hypothetical protein ACXWQQ_07395 [Pseudobdellovibrio sp.]